MEITPGGSATVLQPMSRRLLAVYLVGLWVLALLPIGHGGAWVSPVPLETISAALARGLTFATLVSVGGNVAAFVPLGLLAPVAAASRPSGWKVMVIGVGISLGIEVAQLVISLLVGHPYRSADVDDVLLNGMGTVTGYAIWRAAQGLGGRRWMTTP